MMERRRRPRKPPGRPLVHVVDDHDDTRELYVICLTASGYDVIALNSASAFTRVWETHPDIIVTELVLRNCDGFEFIRALKRDPRTRDIPVVVVTGDGASMVREEAEREGCAGFFVKPFPPDELAAELRHVLAGQAVDDHGIVRIAGSAEHLNCRAAISAKGKI